MTSQTSNVDNPSPVRVVVIGAGYAGMIATNRFLGSLTEDEQQRITLTVVNERSDFVERIRLHQLAAGSRESVTLPLSGVLHPGADIVVGRARLIDTAAETVQAAETLLASIRDTALPLLSIGFVIQCISLGRKNGYIQVVRPDDTPRAFHLGGRLGARVKEMVCTMVVSTPKKEITWPRAYSWPKGPKRKPAQP